MNFFYHFKGFIYNTLLHNFTDVDFYSLLFFVFSPLPFYERHLLNKIKTLFIRLKDTRNVGIQIQEKEVRFQDQGFVRATMEQKSCNTIEKDPEKGHTQEIFT